MRGVRLILASLITIPLAVQEVRATEPDTTLSEFATHVAPPIRGVLRAVDRAIISTSAALLAVKLPFREGVSFKRGDVLAEFDCRREIADAEAAEANFEEASLNVSSAVALDRQKAVGKNDVEIAKIREARAKAEFEAMAPRLDECKLLAPFNGRVVELAIRPYERTEAQKPYLTIIDDSRLEIEVIVPSRMLSELKVGAGFQFLVDELNGAAVTARITSIGASVEAVSKTVKLIGTVEQGASGVLAGMSGTVRFEGDTH